MHKTWKLGVLLVGLLFVVGLQMLAAGPIKITFNTPFHESDAQAMEQIIDGFNASRTDIQVELIQGSWTSYYTELRLAAIAGNAPQLGISHVNKLVEMVDFFTPLDDLFGGVGIGPDDFGAASWNAGQLNGQQYMIPLDTHGFGMFYNKDIFREAGLDPDNPPATLEEFLDACDAIKATGYYAWHPAEDGAPRKYRRSWYVNFWQMGGELFDAGYTKALFNNAKGLLALQFLVDVFNDFGYNVVGGNGPNQFVAGRLGILTGGNWYYGLMTGSGIDWGYMKMPNFFGTAYSWGNSHNIVIPFQPAGTSDAVYDAAMQVAQYVVQHSSIWTMSGGHITAFLDAQRDTDLLASDYWQKSGYLLAEMANDGLVHFPINHPKGSQLESALQSNIELAVTGQITPKEALDRAEAECNRILQDN
jgi:multiple sugar transport system substrate-binding protein